MSEYSLSIGPKTRFLNFFRRIFKLPLLEKFLLKQIDRSPSLFWRKLIPPDYLYKKGSFRRTTIDGIKYELDIHNVVEHLVYFRVAPENFQPVDQVIKNAGVIFDIGGNIGSTALYFAKTNPSARIFSFEPHPKTFEKAKANIELNGFKNIHLENKGMGERVESKKLFEVVDNNPGMNRIMPENSPFPFTWIQLTTLDTFCIEHGITNIDFIKIDVEGFECHVLTGGKNIISTSYPVVYLELYDHGLKKNGYSASALVSMMKQWGYNRFTNAYDMSVVDESTDLTDCDFDIIFERG